MKESLSIKKTIFTLKKKLEENNHIVTLELEDGTFTDAKCTFYDPVSDEDIMQFTDILGYTLPEDYITFLKLTNGCRLFDHPIYGGENYLYGLWEIARNTYEEPNDGFLKVGYFYEENIYFDLKMYDCGEKNYLYVKEHIDQFREGRALHMNFEIWLERFIDSQGMKFWN